MPYPPVAQNILFKNQKKTILLPAAGKRWGARTALRCCKSFGLPSYCADPSVLIQFACFFGLSCANTNDSALPTFTPLFFCLWPKRAPLWQTDLRKKCFLSWKNTTFFNFRRTDFPKAPLRGFKSTPFPLNPLLPLGSVLENGAACDDLSRLYFSAFRFQV